MKILKRITLSFLFLAIFFPISQVKASPSCVDIVEGQYYDAGVCKSCSPSGTYHIRVKTNGDVRRSYIWFDISQIVAPVESAQLTIDAEYKGQEGATVGVYLMDSWSCSYTPNSLDLIGSAVITSSGLVTFDLDASRIDWGSDDLYLCLAMTDEEPTSAERHVDFDDPCLSFTYQPCAGYEVSYSGRSYDPETNTTTFTYVVNVKDYAPHETSHWVLELPDCITENDIKSAGPGWNGEVGEDPTTGVRGIKFEVSIQPGTSETFTLTLYGDAQEQNAEYAIKAGTEVCKGNTTGPSCPVLKADLGVQKTCHDLVAGASGQLAYTIVVTNHGPNKASNVVLTDTLPSELSNATYELDGSPQGSWTGSITWSTMAAEESHTIKIYADVSPSLSGSISNTVEVSSDTSDPGQYPNSATCTSSVNHCPTANDDYVTMEAGTSVVIDVLANDSDPDGDSLTIVSVTQPSHGTVINNGDTVKYTPNSGYCGEDSFTYTISDSHSCCGCDQGGSCDGCSDCDSSCDQSQGGCNCCCDSNEVTATVYITVVDGHIVITPDSAVNEVGVAHTFDITAYACGAAPNSWDLSYTLNPTPDQASLSGPTVSTDGMSATWTLTINEDSPASFELSASVTMDFGDLKITRTTDGTGQNSGPATKDYIEVRLTLSPSTASNQVGDEHTLTAKLEYNDGTGWKPVSGETIGFEIVSGPGALSSTSAVTDTNGEASVTLTSSEAGTTVVRASFSGVVGEAEVSVTSNDATKTWVGTDLTISKVAVPDSVKVGETLTYTLVVTNLGPADAREVVVKDVLQPCLLNPTFYLGRPEIPPAEEEREEWKGTYTVDLLPAGNSLVINIAATTSAECGCEIPNEATVSSATYELDSENNKASTLTTLAYESSLEVTVEPDKDTAYVGETIIYTITVRNTGEVALKDIKVEDTLTGFSETIPNLIPGESVDFTASYVTTDDDACGIVIDAVTAQGLDPCGQVIAAAEARTEVEVNYNAALGLTKTADVTTKVKVGDEITYEITVTNIGDVTLYNVVVSDEKLGFYETMPELGPGESRTFTVKYVVSPDDAFGPEGCPECNVAEAEPGTPLPGPLTNTARAWADGPCGNTVGPVEATYSTPWWNDPPVAEDRSYTTGKGIPITVRLVGRDPDLFHAYPQGHPLSFTIVGAPGHGMLSGDLNNVAYVASNTAYVELLYTPDPDFVGTDRFDFIVRDPYDAFDTGTITITIQEVELVAGGAAAALKPVAINEVAWGGTPADPEHEWIELVNLTDQPIDLNGWTLRWRRKDVENPEDVEWKVLELSGTIEPYGYFILERLTPDAVADIPERNASDFLYGTGKPESYRLADEGEVIELLDPEGIVVDTANADPRRKSGWAAGYGINGAAPYATMERVDPAGPDIDENWTSNAMIVVNGLDLEGDFVEGTARMQNEDAWLYSPLTENPWIVDRGQMLTFRFPAPEEGIEPWIVLVKVDEGVDKHNWPRFRAFEVQELRDGIYECRIYTENLPLGRYQFWISLSHYRVYGFSFEVVEEE